MRVINGIEINGVIEIYKIFVRKKVVFFYVFVIGFYLNFDLDEVCCNL